MIGKITGIIDEFDNDVVVIDVGGIGYNVFCAQHLLSVDDKVTLYIETVIKEDAFLLFGFKTKMERTWFRLFVEKVNGVGPKTAMAILSKLAPTDLAAAVDNQEHKQFLAIPGIGPKVATRIVTELKGKVPEGSYFDEGHNNSQVGKNVADAISALVNLGFPKDRATLAIKKVIEEDKEITDTETLIRLGMKRVASL